MITGVIDHAVRVDLHVHSAGSPDGSLNASNLERMFTSGGLDCIAITDHDMIDSALALQNRFGPERIIVGEEVATLEGEIIGLFLQQTVAAGLSAKEAAQAIKEQGGLVYIPHPFETMRKGITLEALDKIAADVDIVEVWNGRAFFDDHGNEARAWAIKNGKAVAASSDAHGNGGWGRTCSILEDMPTQKNLVSLLRTATLSCARVSFPGILYPQLNRIRKRMKKGA